MPPTVVVSLSTTTALAPGGGAARVPTQHVGGVGSPALWTASAGSQDDPDGPRKRPNALKAHADVLVVGASGLRLALARRPRRPQFRPYPPPSQQYPPGVFCHPGILHRNSSTESRAIASSLVAGLKHRDLSCQGDKMEPESLGDGVSAPTSTRASATSPSWSSRPPPHQPSSVARQDFSGP